MMKHLREVSKDIVHSLSAQEKMVIVLLYGEQLRVAEVSEVLEIPPERVIAIAAHVQCRVRMAITGGLRLRAVPLWEQADVGRPTAPSARRLSYRCTGVRRACAPLIRRHRRAAP